MNKVSLKLRFVALMMLLGALVVETTAVAQPVTIPFIGRSKHKTVQLNLTQQAGPWLIMCAAFDGVDGRQQAVNLANELRTKHGLNAYVYRQHFDFTSSLSNLGRGYQRPTSGGAANLRQREMHLVKQDEKTEYAVLVGDYKTVESADAQKTLAMLKRLQPESLKIYSQDIRTTSQAGERLRADSEAMYGSGSGVKKLSTVNAKFPLRLALLVTNPMIPEEKLAEAEVDHYILNINRDLKYTLLDNPKAYTLKIASFSGDAIARPQEKTQRQSNNRLWPKKDKQGDDTSGLVIAAKRAKVLTEYLRSKNVEAYQFHDRYSSYVCVGGFDWVRDGEGPDASANPRVAALAEVFAAKPAPTGGGQITTFPLPRRLLEAGVTCDATPLTVAVPRAKGQLVRKRSLQR